MIQFFFSYFRFTFLLCFSLLCLSRLPSLPARIIPDAVTVVTENSNSPASRNATWQDFVRLIDVGKGSQLSGVADLKRYFHRFGYLGTGGADPNTNNLNFSGFGANPNPNKNNFNFSDLFDGQLESAVLAYQRNLGLRVTGKLDSDTVSAIMSPRCGVADSLPPPSAAASSSSSLHATKRFAYFYGRPRWQRGSDGDGDGETMTLTYAFSPDHRVNYLSAKEVREVFRRAFGRWSATIPVTFREARDYSSADIKIGWYRGDHGDGEAFDGVLGVLAHAFSPENGRLHLDAAETWAAGDDFSGVTSRVAVDLESVATHEIGHVLGLAHSSVKEAVMYPSLSPRMKKVELKVDDVEGIQALYGSNPNFKFNSLLAAENSSNSLGFGMTGVRRSSAAWTHFALAVGLSGVLLSCI